MSTTAHRTEQKPQSTAGGGTAAEPFAPVAEAFGKLVGNADGGGALVVRMGGETVVDLHAGTADRDGDRPWTPDTLAVSFSTTKGLASTVVHRLADRDEIDYDEPVATYWPEFAAGGKEKVTVADLLTHRAGLSSVRAVADEAEDLLDHIALEDRLAERSVRAPTERSAYHAFTYGWLVAGLARRVTGSGLADLVRTEIAEPLETDGLNVGADGVDLARVAEPVGSALRQLAPVMAVLGPLWQRATVTRAWFDALIVPGFHRLFEGEEPQIWATEMPAVNGLLSADALSRLYGALANRGTFQGTQLLSPETTHALGRVKVRSADDGVLGIPMRWRLGYHQAFGTGREASKAFGHYGYGGSGGWADPELGVSLGFVTNRIGSVSTPLGDFTLFRLSKIVRECAERAARDLGARTVQPG